MSDAKFASITAALLARKGEAAPSILGGGATVRSFLVHVPEPVVVRKHAARSTPVIEAHNDEAGHSDHAAHPDRKRRVVVTLTSEEYQRLGIIAAKKNSTRHDIVRDVLFEQLDAYAREQAAECSCINSDAACSCSTPAETTVTEP